MEPTGEPTTVYLDPSGDLRLLVEYEDKQTLITVTNTFVVSSQVMCLASPVWRAMLDPNGHFMEAQDTSKDRKARLLGDDPNALLLVLRIAHLDFKNLPSKLDDQEVWHLADLCDKYDIVKLVRPWITKWMQPMGRYVFAKVDPNDHERWLFVA